jgi:hypothetical protein
MFNQASQKDTLMLKRYQNKTTPELLEMLKEIMADPENAQQDSLHLCKPKARKKMEQIEQAITNNLAEARDATGNPVPTNGYTGRNSNRR